MKSRLFTLLALHLGLAAAVAQPVISSPPTNKTVRVGETAFFTVDVTGTPPLTYQWRKDGADILGATGATCALGLTRTNLTGSYTVVVSNPSGSVTNAPPAELNVIPPQLGDRGIVLAWGENNDAQTTVPPAAQGEVTAIAAGQVHTVALKNDGSVVAWGYNPFGQTTVPVAAQSGVTAIAAGGDHTVALKNDGSVVAWGYNLWGQTTVPVAAQSGVMAIAAGGYHTVALKNDGTVVAWGYNLQGQTTVPAAARSGVMAIAAGGYHTVALQSDGSVVAWGNNCCGQTTVPVAAQSRVTAIAAGGDHTVAIFMAPAPAIAMQPLSQTVGAGQSATFAATATGFYLNYQWQFNGVDIPGATNPMLQLDNVTRIQAGSYTVAVSNYLGSVTSEVATLTVRVFAPAITTQPVSQSVVAGDSVALFVAVSGAPPPKYQWLFNGMRIPGATNMVLQLDNVARSQAGNYSVVADNSEGFVISEVATLTVNFKVQFTTARYWVWETGRVAVITVARGGDGPETVTVNYATSDGTATAGQDYTATTGTLTFGPGEAEKSFTILILDDALPEGAEYLRVSLSGLTGPAVFGANTNEQLTILDDEKSSPPVTRARPVLAAGASHAVALKADGSLWAWGEGYLGLGDVYSTNVPTRVGSDHDWATVAAGRYHTLAIKTNGSLWAWGNNCGGQLGVEVVCPESLNAPIRVGADNDWQMVAAGGSHSVGLKADGTVWAWGSWDDFNGINRPRQIGCDSDWTWIGSGLLRSLAIKTDGSLWELNANESTAVGTDHDWEMVTTGGYIGGLDPFHFGFDLVALKADGSLWSWSARCSSWSHDCTRNIRIDLRQVGADNDWATIAAAEKHTLSVKADGSLWAWGENLFGRLGLGVDTGPDQLDPAQVGEDNDWVAVAAGPAYSIGLKSDGSLWSWGVNWYGLLGLGDDFSGQIINVPTRIGTNNDWALPSAWPVRGEFRITAHSINADHSRTLLFSHTNWHAYYVLYRGDSLANITQPVDAALVSALPRLTDRSVLASNANAFYRIRAVPRTQPLDLDGDGIDDDYEFRHTAFLNPLNSDDAAQDYDGDGYSNLAEYRAGTDPTRLTVRHSIASGLAHTVVLKEDGSLWARGDNTYGQLGDGTYESRAEPVRIGADTDWVSVTAGRDFVNGDYTVALKRDGSLWFWGSRAFTNAPIRLGNEINWADVSAGGNFIVAVKKDGSLCYPQAFSPSQRIGTDCDWVTVSSGGQHILALKSDRSLWAWGNNDFGQCGLGEGGPSIDTPTRVGTDNDWIAIAASGDGDGFDGTHSLGLKADGTLWSWGYDQAGELGLGNSGFNRYTPARVGTDPDWVAIAAGAGTSLARERDGSLWMWGLGIGAVPSLTSERRDWRDSSAGGAVRGNFATAVAADGTLWQWRPGQPPQQIGTATDWGLLK